MKAFKTETANDRILREAEEKKMERNYLKTHRTPNCLAWFQDEGSDLYSRNVACNYDCANCGWDKDERARRLASTNFKKVDVEVHSYDERNNRGPVFAIYHNCKSIVI